ncbi:MAG: HlyD family efflux transporter periplasmic adaptor subunit [Planctomycetaceae bacterium]|jgi:biotin carboxyl carrier protein|nr:HlyD family efflux transporter periplasmic adaptor subunit [Planctomycetaceae bacterium]
MYNSLTLIALIPLMGPEIAAQSELNPTQTNIVTNNQYVQPTDKIPLPANSFAVPLSTPNSTQSLISAAKNTDTDNTNNIIAANNFKENVLSASNQVVTSSNGVNELTTDGILEIPKRNQIILAAPCSAVLMHLKTIQDHNKELHIVEGMYVKKGQILGKFDDRTLQNQLRIDEAQLNVAIAAEEKIIEIEYAARTLQVAITKLNTLKEVNKQHPGTIPAMEILLAEHEKLQAEANLNLCKYTIEHERKEETNVKRQTVEATKTNIQIRQLVSPIDGIITKIEHAEGEYIREGEPVLEITQLDTLRALCQVNAGHCSQSRLEGEGVTIIVQKKNDTETFSGKIIFINPKIITSSNTYEIFVEIKNQKVGNSWKLLPGTQITTKIKL